MYEFDYSLKKEMDERWKESQPLIQQWWYEADLDTKMATGQQDYSNSFFGGANNYRNQKQLQFNKILRVLNMVGGYQRKNRLQTVVNASQSGDINIDDQETADEFTEVLSWVMRQDDTYEKISDCFDGSNIAGLNLLSIWIDHREDVENGMIRTNRIPFNAFLMDNYWVNTDLSDCDYIWTRKYLSRPQVLSLNPRLKKELPNLKQGPGAKDGRFQFLAQNWYQYQQDLFAYDEYFVRKYRKIRKLVDRVTGETAEWKGTREQFQLLRQYNPNIELISAMKPTVKLHVLVNGHLVYEEDRPYNIDSYPFVPFLCYHFPEVQNYAYRYQGIVRNIRDSQIELNRRRNRMLDILDSQIQSGLMVKEDALVNPEDAFIQGPGRILYFKNTANLATDQVQIQPTTWNPGMLEMAQIMDQEIMSIAGATDELFGENTDGKDMSGFLSQLRMGAGLVSMQGIFDKLNQSQKQVGNVMLEMIQENFEASKVRQIISKDPTEQFYSKTFSKYHCIVEEAALTSTQRQLQLVQALQLKQLGIPVSNKYILSKSTLQGKKEIMEDLEQQDKQAAEMQENQAHLEMAKLALEAKQLESVSQANFAAAEERKTRSIANIAMADQKLTQGQADEARGALDNAKALKELEHMDENQLLKLSDFIVSLHERQKKSQQMDIDNARYQEERATQDIQASKQSI